MKPLLQALLITANLIFFSATQADVLDMGGIHNPDGSWTGLASLETVPVGNRGNGGEWSGESHGGDGPNCICGAVDYDYYIGKYEVTAAQYTEFLNAVAHDDTYGLYNEGIWVSDYGCKIERSGQPGSYAYSVASEWANRPVNFVSWGDAARFANWMHNDQPSGAQDLNTTEDGSYFLNGVTDDAGLLAITRKPNATWVIPSEDEWYKAAYHKNDGVTGHYWNYPTGTDEVPNNGNPGGDTGNSANFSDDDSAIGSPYWRTEVGRFSLSDSPYGTFDQGGNVWEWNEAVIGSEYALRGGSAFSDYAVRLHAAVRQPDYTALTDYVVGFRLALVPEPASLTLLVLVGMLARRRKIRGARTV